MATPTVTPLDPSALSGAPTLGAYPPAPSPSAMPTQTEQSSQGPIQVVPNAMPPQAAGTPSVWKNLTMGALWGLSNMGRAHTFGQGVAQGAQGAIHGQQVARENAIQQQQLQFESARAADDHIRAVAQAKEADAATDDHKAQLAQYQANIDAFNEAMGIKPTLTIKGDNPNAINSQASGGLQTLASRNGGTIPGVVTVNNPAGAKNSDHSIDVYAKPTPQELQNNPNGYRKLVDIASIVNNGSPTTDEQWNTGNFAMEPGSAQQGMKMLMQKSQGQAQMVLAAQQRLYGVPQVVGNPSKDDATSATLQQQLEAYQKRPDADAGVVKLLQSQLQTFNSAVKNAQDKTASIKTEQDKPQAGLVNGKPGFAVYAGAGKGFVDPDTGKPIADFKPQPTFAETGLYEPTNAVDPKTGSIVPAKFDRRSGEIVGYKGESGLLAIPPGADKEIGPAMADARGADQRLRIMEENEPDALKGNQQAMLSIVANHIGMTLGAQKGARINQAVWNEAIESAPILARAGARFDKQGYLTGVTLTPEQTKQMVDLGRTVDEANWKKAEDTFSNYGIPFTRPASAGSRNPTQQVVPPGGTPILKGGKTVGYVLDGKRVDF